MPNATPQRLAGDVSAAYPFPRHDGISAENWRPVRNLKGPMTPDMCRLYDAVATALDKGLHYTCDVNADVGAQLGAWFDNPNDPAIKRVEGGVRGMEIYYARCAVQEHRRLARNIEAATLFEAGQKIRGVRLNGVTYSTAEVMSVNPEKGDVVVQLTKRGSRQRWTTTVEAAALPAPAVASKSAAPEASAEDGETLSLTP